MEDSREFPYLSGIEEIVDSLSDIPDFKGIKYPIGERVVATKRIQTRDGHHIEEGSVGTVLVNDDNRGASDDIIGVRWDDWVGGHNLYLSPEIHPPYGTCPEGHGWFVMTKFDSQIAPLKDVINMEENENWDSSSDDFDEFISELKGRKA